MTGAPAAKDSELAAHRSGWTVAALNHADGELRSLQKAGPTNPASQRPQVRHNGLISTA